MTVVLDSWAIMRLLEGNEPAASRVQEEIAGNHAVMSWINLGEIYYVLHRTIGEDEAGRTVRDIEARVKTVLPDRDLVLEAARIKSSHRMSYADAFAAATAVRFDAPLWTSDPELSVAGSRWNAVNPGIA